MFLHVSVSHTVHAGEGGAQAQGVVSAQWGVQAHSQGVSARGWGAQRGGVQVQAQGRVCTPACTEADTPH